VKPPSGNGKLLWHALGAKTVELINQNVHVESVRDDLETFSPGCPGPGGFSEKHRTGQAAKELKSKLVARLRKHLGNLTFTALGERLEKLKEKHEQGLLTSLEFLKQILELAKDVVEAEKETDPRRNAIRRKKPSPSSFRR